MSWVLVSWFPIEHPQFQTIVDKAVSLCGATPGDEVMSEQMFPDCVCDQAGNAYLCCATTIGEEFRDSVLKWDARPQGLEYVMTRHRPDQSVEQIQAAVLKRHGLHMSGRRGKLADCMAGKWKPQLAAVSRND